MNKLQLPLGKPGDAPAKKLSLSLNKGTRFTVELAWDSGEDLDAHALLATNAGSGAKVDAFEKVLSTYNTKKMNPNAVLTANPNGSFNTPCGALAHSGDCRNGVGQDVDEVITIDGGKVGPEINEIPVFVTIHNSAKTGATFARVKAASITIKDDSGKPLCAYELTGEFSAFSAIQMGSLVLGPNGWEFAAVGTGFNGDFNTVLEHFS